MSSYGAHQDQVEQLWTRHSELGELTVEMPIELVAGLLADLKAAANTVEHLRRQQRAETYAMFLTELEADALGGYLRSVNPGSFGPHALSERAKVVKAERGYDIVVRHSAGDSDQT